MQTSKKLTTNQRKGKIMSNKRKALFIQLTAAVMACITSFIVVLYARGDFDFTFISRPVTESTESEPTDTPEVTDPTVSDTAETGNINSQTPPTSDSNAGDVSDLPDYYQSVIKLPQVWAAKSEGKARYEGLYENGSSVLALVTDSGNFSDRFAYRDMTSTEVVEIGQNWAGAKIYGESAVTVPRPVLQVYFGFILWDDGSTIKLCDGEGRVLMNNISGYEPVGYRDLAGNPLFIKDGIYYYYYDGVSLDPDTVVADQITADTIWQFPLETPECYSLVTADTEYTAVTPTAAGMVPCFVDWNYHNTVRYNSSYEESGNRDPELFRLCERRITKTVTNQAEIDARNAEIADITAKIATGVLPADTPIPAPIEPVYLETDEGTFWGYIDKDGKIVHYPQFISAYDFTTDGLAVITDPSDESGSRLCAINRQGVRIVDAVRNMIHMTAGGVAELRDGHHLPDTLGRENIGMLSFNNSLLRVRRRLINTTGGYVVHDQYDALVDTKGEIFNIPGGYTIVGYSDGVILLEKKGKYGFISASTGEWIANPQYTYAEPFCEGLAVIGFKDGKRCMIDTEGNIVLPMIYDHISQCSDGTVVAYAEGHGWSIYNKMSVEKFTEPSNPILAIKRRIIAQKLFDEAQAALSATGTIAPVQ